MEYAELLGRIDDEKMMEIYASCSRKIRNMLDGLYGKKVKKGRMVSLKSLKDKSGQALLVRDGIVATGENQTAEELLKTWLYAKRPMLAAALDFCGIENDDGITDQELDALEKAEPEKLEQLVAHLTGSGYDVKDVAIYLAFLKVQNFEKVPILTQSLLAD
jgi:hypothetical protein